jgi:hypothetical protein
MYVIYEYRDMEEPKILEKEFSFVRSFLTSWGYVEKEIPTLKALFATPNSFDYKDLVVESDSSKFGEFTIDRDACDRNFENVRVCTPDLSGFMGRPLHEAATYVAETFSSDFDIAGLEYQNFLYRNPEKVPDNLRGGNHCFYFFGSLCRNRSGRWCVPYNFSLSLVLGGSWLGSFLSRKHQSRALLIEKSSV